jgi:hypothetical protein
MNKNTFSGSEISKKLHNFYSKTAENNILEIGCFEEGLLSTIFFADNFLDNPNSTLTCVNDHPINLNCKNVDKITVLSTDEFFNYKKNVQLYIYYQQ